jgi:hypothetical protein
MNQDQKGLTDWIKERAAYADDLALQARAAALAGDNAQADRLRAEFDTIYDELEAASAGDLAPNMRIANKGRWP